MKLIMLTSLAGPGLSLSVGQETDLFDGPEADRLIEKGLAKKAPVRKAPARTPRKKKAVKTDEVA